MKSTTNLLARLFLGLGNEETQETHIGTVIAAGPLHKQPATMAQRVVITTRDGKFTVHNQYFPNFIEGKTPDLSSSYVGGGDYYNSDNFVLAVEKFAERIKNGAGYLESLYRPSVA